MFRGLRSLSKKFLPAVLGKAKEKEPNVEEKLPEGWDQGDTVLLCNNGWQIFDLYHVKRGVFQGMSNDFDPEYAEVLFAALSQRFLDAKTSLSANSLRIMGPNATGRSFGDMPEEDLVTKLHLSRELNERQTFEDVVRNAIEQTAARKGHAFKEIDKKDMFDVFDFIRDKKETTGPNPSP